ncbi:PREDICTED: golgin subfamily A member 6-like protein 1 [Tarenaya hassleriana]|uniref:golgin subfamily A member 6-like protein 1 n=1 Tax=Tarenaya hassleriana TaxID=28532 RepID=UPI00053C3FE7|nr:PREDICTED: golgin subfamily A member 6-like protein 1 [Tarenaya hassleriana]
MASSLPISFQLPVRRQGIRILPRKHSSPSFSVSTSIVCLSAQNLSGDDREEVRWLREEQRWLREEQRWMREEQRWLRERESLLREISDLKLRIQTLESRSSPQGASVSEAISSIGALLQVLSEKNRIAESGSSAKPMVLEEKTREREEVEEVEKRVIAAEEIRVSEGVKEIRTLRAGSEGEEVREMQEALLKLGFYSGEEDMEYSSFSSGTERAVKTWQASLGVREDGIMTVELLQKLFMDELIDKAEETTTQPEIKGAGNGTAVTSVTQVSEMKQTVTKDEGVEEVEVSQHRVFLLGENRWEEPSRLIGKSKRDNERKPADSKPKCLTCRGEGRLMCTECDGTGEPNVEPQFLEWVDEGAKCPYCEGRGYTICDVCGGRASV